MRLLWRRHGQAAPPSGDSALENAPNRSEEHTSELQSRLHLVCRLLLEKNKKPCTSMSAPNTCVPDRTSTTFLGRQHCSHPFLAANVIQYRRIQRSDKRQSERRFPQSVC